MSKPKHKHVTNESHSTADLANEAEVRGPVETAYMVKKTSIIEWQVVELKIQGDKVVSRSPREPDLAAIVSSKLLTELRGA